MAYNALACAASATSSCRIRERALVDPFRALAVGIAPQDASVESA
jgi:hypothetical protein